MKMMNYYSIEMCRYLDMDVIIFPLITWQIIVTFYWELTSSPCEILILTPAQSITPAVKTSNIWIGNIEYHLRLRIYFVFHNTKMMSLCQHLGGNPSYFCQKNKSKKASDCSHKYRAVQEIFYVVNLISLRNILSLKEKQITVP